MFSAAVAALIVPLIPSHTDLLNNLNPESQPTNQAIQDLQAQITSVLWAWTWSFLISIFSAALAISLQRWARPNSMITSPRYGLPEQARLHALFVLELKSLESFHLIKVFHCLVHISLAFFLYGLSKYCKTFNVTETKLVTGWFLVIYFLYCFFTFVPALDPGSPFSTPISPIITIVYTCIARGASRLLYFVKWLISICMRRGAVRQPTGYNRGWTLTKLAEDKAQELTPFFDNNVLWWTLQMLRSDDDLEQFFDAIPGFCGSKIVHNPRRSLDTLGQQRLAEALIGFWNRTLSSKLVPESIKGRRLLVCMAAIEAANLAIAAPGTLRDFSFRYLGGIARSVEVGHSLGNLRHGNIASLARGIIASIIFNAERNDCWSMLAIDELGISRDVLQDYLARGDSVLLANLIHITRHFLHGLLQPHPDLTREALTILPSVSKFDILNTLPELQHDFCALWNDVVPQAQSSGADNNPLKEILLEFWGFYVALHGAAASNYDPLRPPASYPSCEDDGHRSMTTHVQ